MHWISLRPEVKGLVVPSKFYGIACAGRPVIAITARNGEIAWLVEQHGCGLVIEPGRAETLAEALTLLAADDARTAAMRPRPGDTGCSLHASAGIRALAAAARSRGLSSPSCGRGPPGPGAPGPAVGTVAWVTPPRPDKIPASL